jgi:hypothetical protein
MTESKLTDKKLNDTFRELYKSLDPQQLGDLLGEMGLDVDETTHRFYMPDREHDRLYLSGEQLADAKREFIEWAHSMFPTKIDRE